jgi:hypothetical protein
VRREAPPLHPGGADASLLHRAGPGSAGHESVGHGSDTSMLRRVGLEEASPVTEVGDRGREEKGG